MNNRVAYIAGPIQGHENQQEYRTRLAALLDKEGYHSIDPWKREAMLYSSEEGNMNREEMAGFIKRDLIDIERCELFIAYLPKLSAGTCMELFHAKSKGKKTVVITDMRDISPWIVYHTDVMVGSIEEFEEILPDL